MMKFFFLIFFFFTFLNISQAETNNIDQSPLMNLACKLSVEKAGAFYFLKDASFTEDESYFYAGISNQRGSDKVFSIYRQSKISGSEPETFLEIPGSAVDLKYYNGSLWALHGRVLTQINLQNKEIKDLVLSSSENFHKFDHAYDMVIWNDKIVITHGTIGLMVVDPKTLRLVRTIDIGMNQTNGHRSLASSLAFISHNEVMIAVDGLTVSSNGTNPFNGIVEVNLITGAYKNYPYQVGVISRFSRMLTKQGMLLINNWGTFHYASIESIRSKKEVNPNWIPTKYTENGNKYSVDLLGDLLQMNDSIYSCGRSRQTYPKSQVDDFGILFKIPLNIR